MLQYNNKKQNALTHLQNQEIKTAKVHEIYQENKKTKAAENLKYRFISRR